MESNLQNLRLHAPLTPAPADALWSRFRAHVESRRARGQICLLPILITGFPDRPRQAGYARMLRAHGIALAEIVEPIADGFAATTNTVIRDAHQTALPHAAPDDGAALAAGFTGTLRVVYPGNVPGDGRRVDAESAGVYSILQLACPPAFIRERGLDQLEMPVTTLVSADQPAAELEAAVAAARWMVVCKIAPATGAGRFSPQVVAAALQRIRRLTTLPVFCTFGILDAAAIERLRALGTCDGAIVGTALLNLLSRDAGDTDAFLASLRRAAFE